MSRCSRTLAYFDDCLYTSAMVIECHSCGAKVDGEVVGVLTEPYDPEGPPGEYSIVLLKCPLCKCGIVGHGYDILKEGCQAEVDRAWPSPKRSAYWDVPDPIRESLDEAEICFSAKAYSACIAMSGRALEGVCRYFKTQSPYLGGGLGELQKKGIIDQRLFQWSEQLHQHRNFAAHASGARYSKEDARDLADFAWAICDYVFVLSKKFEKFKDRIANREAQKHKNAKAV